jgi:plastocyanin
MKHLRSSAMIATVVLIGLIGTACGSKTPATGGGSGPTTPAATGGGGYGGGYGGGGGVPSSPAGSAASATIKQGAGGQLAFSPATLTVKQGDTIEIQDVSAISHTFTIDGQGVDLVNAAGQSQTATLSLAPGTYTYICRFHVGSGMQGTLTVTG